MEPGALVGTTLGRYEVRAEIGRGRLSAVYEAYDGVNEQPVVAKVLTAEPGDDSTFRQRFENLAQALTGLNHPNVLKLYDHGVDPERGLFYLIYPFIGGATLDQQLGAPWPLEEAVRIAAEVARALDHAHGQGLVHGDVRPNNVLLTSRGWPLLTDFGLWDLLRSGQMTDLDADVEVYRAPEQLQGAPASPATDLYGLGGILYEMLTGRPPLREGGAVTPPRRLRAEVPRPLEQIVLKSLTSDPDQRYPSAGEMARALEETLEETGGASARPRAITPPSGVRTGEAQAALPPASGAIAFTRQVGGALWRVSQWLLVRAMVLGLILVLVATALLVGGAYATGQVARRILAAQDWGWQPQPRPTEVTTSESFLQQRLAEMIAPYTQGILTDPQIDLVAPDRIVFRGQVYGRPLEGVVRIGVQDGAPFLRVERINGVVPYLIGDLITNGVNEGLRLSWDRQPVRLRVLETGEDHIRAVVEPKPEAASPSSPSSPGGGEG